MSAPQYWRDRKQWSTWLKRKGIVIASTRIHVAPPGLVGEAPYPYVLVDFGDEKRSYMGVGHEVLYPGDTVECVWRKIGAVDDEDIIRYGIKVKRVGATLTGDELSEPENSQKSIPVKKLEEISVESADAPAYR